MYLTTSHLLFILSCVREGMKESTYIAGDIHILVVSSELLTTGESVSFKYCKLSALYVKLTDPLS